MHLEEKKYKNRWLTLFSLHCNDCIYINIRSLFTSIHLTFFPFIYLKRFFLKKALL